MFVSLSFERLSEPALRTRYLLPCSFLLSLSSDLLIFVLALAAMPERLWDSMVDKNRRSASVPFLPAAAKLDGTAPGDYGFDPFYLSSIPKNFAGFLQPPSWEDMGDGIDTLYWMREAEIKVRGWQNSITLHWLRNSHLVIGSTVELPCWR
jgi:hypothetical protein